MAAITHPIYRKPVQSASIQPEDVLLDDRLIIKETWYLSLIHFFYIKPANVVDAETTPLCFEERFHVVCRSHQAIDNLSDGKVEKIAREIFNHFIRLRLTNENVSDVINSFSFLINKSFRFKRCLMDSFAEYYIGKEPDYLLRHLHTQISHVIPFS